MQLANQIAVASIPLCEAEPVIKLFMPTQKNQIF
jgi:hypothetical protein